MTHIAIINIPRPVIQSGSVGFALTRLNKMQDDLGSIGMMAHGGAVALFADGYSADRRELCEIPEVVRYWRRLFAAFPLLPFVLSNQNQGTQLKLLLTALFDVRVHHGKHMGMEFINAPQTIHAEIWLWLVRARNVLEKAGKWDEAVKAMLDLRMMEYAKLFA
ncbi:hypothetical protein A4U49_15495 [Acidithiobacillus ferrivorans]|jgi:hypothetical protein|uniref:hypothetical protein n=1 Tax=Acidithiobacillus ferrivorans TaxID=160808 RepID=UPI000892D508|nr:hypothetical protein [Acidithiobacillus ferrivorans]OFA14981.1 hypothetical protein A4U49_15495 [Acidithiobacillus ferrivorans]